MDKEFSAGGLVGRDGKLLLVKVTNLAGDKVWTFPKGHLDKGETALQAALREVEEETGWRCKSLGPLTTVAYKFSRQGRPVAKRVKWYRMEPFEKVGEPDASEIDAVKWVSTRAAAKWLKYPSDFKLLELWGRK
ncbi:MAG: NUDIX domain-containing protein [Elusimicrobia bacterium]|nr:NUDIX domain-containing protein [Elusimicrobiota bacterium]